MTSLRKLSVDFAALTAAVGAGVSEVLACLIVSRDGLALGSLSNATIYEDAKAKGRITLSNSTVKETRTPNLIELSPPPHRNLPVCWAGCPGDDPANATRAYYPFRDPVQVPCSGCSRRDVFGLNSGHNIVISNSTQLNGLKTFVYSQCTVNFGNNNANGVNTQLIGGTVNITNQMVLNFDPTLAPLVKVTGYNLGPAYLREIANGT